MFRFKRIIINLLPGEIYAVLPKSEVDVVRTGLFSKEYEVFSVHVSTAADDFDFEFESETERDEFIDSMASYLSGTTATQAVANTESQAPAKTTVTKKVTSKK